MRIIVTFRTKDHKEMIPTAFNLHKFFESITKTAETYHLITKEIEIVAEMGLKQLDPELYSALGKD